MQVGWLAVLTEALLVWLFIDTARTKKQLPLPEVGRGCPKSKADSIRVGLVRPSILIDVLTGACHTQHTECV
jgi:hypothetical protein